MSVGAGYHDSNMDGNLNLSSVQLEISISTLFSVFRHPAGTLQDSSHYEELQIAAFSAFVFACFPRRNLPDVELLSTSTEEVTTYY